MRKREAEFCSELQKWLKHNWRESCVIEAKVCQKNHSLNYKSDFQSHQLPTLINIEKGKLPYKISDMDRQIKPYDIIFHYYMPSYVVIYWYGKGCKEFYMIKPEDIIDHRDKGNKSLDEEQAKIISCFVGELK